MDKKIVLGIDTSGIKCGIALWSDYNVLYQKTVEAPNLHSTLLAGFVRAGLEELNLEPSSVQLVCITAGPGSFTGLRIGMAYAKGFCFALDKPLIAVSNFEILASQAPDAMRPIYVLINARRGLYYLGNFYQENLVLGSCKVIKISDLKREMKDPGSIVIEECNNDKFELSPDLQRKVIRSKLEMKLICQLGFQKYLSGYQDDLHILEPLYIQPFAGVS